MKSFIRLRQRSRVLLPQPDGPMMAVMLRSGKVNDTSWMAWLVPYHTLSPSVDRAASPDGTSAADCAAWASLIMRLPPRAASRLPLRTPLHAGPQDDGQGVEAQHDHQQDEDPRGGDGMKALLGARHPVVDLDRH